MSDLSTPETEILYNRLLAENPGNLIYLAEMLELARRLERERDEAIFSKNTSAADFLKQIRQITLCKDVAREKLLMAEKERDETRKQFVDFLNKTEDYKRERDEARAAIPAGEWVSYEDHQRVHDAASRLLVAINSKLPIGDFSLIEAEYRTLKDALYGK